MENNWSDVQSWFEMNEPEPDEIILAEYDTESYEGFALVIYRIGDLYYTVEGSHCSCYGLENQWYPDSGVTKDIIKAMYERIEPSKWGMNSKYRNDILEKLNVH